MSEHDDLTGWDDDDLVRALRAPGTAAELADEERYVAAFREVHGPAAPVRSLPRRAVGRLGAGGTAVVVTVALTSGVAAAYTGHLPDPVQQIAHSVIGAPPPDGGSGSHPGAAATRPGQVLSPLPSGSAATSTQSPGASPVIPSSTPSGSVATPGAGSVPASSPHGVPTSTPSSQPTPSSSSSTPTATLGTPGGMTAAGGTHRAGVGETVTLSSTLTATDGTPLAGYPVVLQVHGPLHWRPVTQVTTDASGLATATTPPMTRSARFRWHTDHRVHSDRWVVLMVPGLSASADVGGTSTTVSASAQGGRPGDRVQLVRWIDHRPVTVRRAGLDATGAATFVVPTPSRKARFAVRLLPTAAHTAAHAGVSVVPPTVASVGIAASSHQVLVGGSLTVSGVVRAADGSPLVGRRVALQVRGPRRWYGVGSATTDGSGAVALATPAARRTVRYRLRVPSGVHSASWRVAMVPTLSAGTRPDGAGADIVATAQGGFTGDGVALLRRVSGRLVVVQHAPLAADGSVVFTVPRRVRSTTYVVRLLGTGRHTAASTKVTVAGTG